MALTKEFFLSAIGDLTKNMNESMDTKLSAMRSDMNMRDSAFQTKMMEINTQNEAKLQASLAKALDEQMEKTNSNIRSAIGGVEQKMEGIIKDVEQLKLNGQDAPMGGAGDPWQNYSRAGENGPSKMRRVGESSENRRASDRPENVLDEAFVKSQCKIKVDGFLGNSSNEYCAESLKTFLGTLEHYTGKGEIKAYGKYDSTAYIIFESPQQAKGFLKTNGKHFKSFMPKGVDGTARKMKFTGWTSKKDHKKKAATNVYGNILKQKFAFSEDQNFHWDNVRACVRVKDFQVVSISIDDDSKISFHIKDRNINDCGVALLKEAIEAAITEFRKVWIP